MHRKSFRNALLFRAYAWVAGSPSPSDLGYLYKQLYCHDLSKPLPQAHYRFLPMYTLYVISALLIVAARVFGHKNSIQHGVAMAWSIEQCLIWPVDLGPETLVEVNGLFEG